MLTALPKTDSSASRLLTSIFPEPYLLPRVLCGPETLQTDEGSTSDSCFCPLPPTDETVLAVHWDIPGVWPYSGQELATLQSVYPESTGQESGKLAASTRCWIAPGTSQWLRTGEVSANLSVDYSMPLGSLLRVMWLHKAPDLHGAESECCRELGLSTWTALGTRTTPRLHGTCELPNT